MSEAAASLRNEIDDKRGIYKCKDYLEEAIKCIKDGQILPCGDGYHIGEYAACLALICLQDHCVTHPVRNFLISLGTTNLEGPIVKSGNIAFTKIYHLDDELTPEGLPVAFEKRYAIYSKGMDDEESFEIVIPVVKSSVESVLESLYQKPPT